MMVRRRLRLFRVPGSGFRVLEILLLTSCSPATTRPDFFPYPQAPKQLLGARRERIVPALVEFITVDSLRIQRASALDGYVETEWYDMQQHRSYARTSAVPDLAHTIKLRCWVDPYVPGQSILTVEAVYRPRVDPSRIERELEIPLSPDHPGYQYVEAVLNRARERFGLRKATEGG
ncbi:MAG TPA: hypothetical protein VLV45_03520 [Gemmatimonadales bacterium]|nr:hypothetical protein [Gemmatimonadales bacterium]